MARVTVEDCLDKVDNRFQLVLVSSKRARQLARGAPALLDWENDKPTVMALREIAAGEITPDNVDEIGKVVVETPDDELAELLREAAGDTAEEAGGGAEAGATGASAEAHDSAEGVTEGAAQEASDDAAETPRGAAAEDPDAGTAPSPASDSGANAPAEPE